MIGGVRIEEDEHPFSQLQSLEFVSVAVTGAATLGLGFPTMCNGANLSYRREAFMRVEGYKGNERISSGDDEHLMNKLQKASKRSIGYLYSSDAVVTTSPLPNVTSFVNQRLRWAGKWRSNTSLPTQTFAVVVWLFHLTYVALAFAALLGSVTWKLFIILAGAKILVEALLLIPATKFFQVRWSWISFLVLQFTYSVYVIAVGLMSQVLLPEWKGRAVGTKI
jgi:biofilm PGA synthesis N-glycosyltransferase PgaC